MFLSFSWLYEGSLAITDIVLPWSIDIVFRIIKEFNPVGNPSCNSGNSKEDRVHISGETHSSINEPRIEVNVGIKFSGDTKLLRFLQILIFEGNFLKFKSNFNQRFFPTNFKYLKSNLLLYLSLLF